MTGSEIDQSADLRRARSVLFVCLGNICRSPLAKAAFEHAATQRGVRDQLRVDSCGTGHWHVGGPADPRTIEVARRHELPLRHVARQVNTPQDFQLFDLLIPMDRSNLKVLDRAGCPAGKARLFLSFAARDLADPRDLDAIDRLEVPDPYHGGDEGFEQMHRLVTLASEGLLNAMFPRG